MVGCLKLSQNHVNFLSKPAAVEEAGIAWIWNIPDLFLTIPSPSIYFYEIGRPSNIGTGTPHGHRGLWRPVGVREPYD